MLFGVSVHEEAAAAVSVGRRVGMEFQYIRAVIFAVDRRAGDNPVTAGDGADVGDVLYCRVVRAFAGAGVSGRDVRAVLLKIAPSFGRRFKWLPGRLRAGFVHGSELGHLDGFFSS